MSAHVSDPSRVVGRHVDARHVDDQAADAGEPAEQPGRGGFRILSRMARRRDQGPAYEPRHRLGDGSR